MTNLRKYKNCSVKSYNSYTQYVNQIVNYDEQKWLDFFDKEIKSTLKKSFGSIENLKSIAFVPNLVIWSFHLQQLLPFTSPCINFNKEEPINNLREAMKDVRKGLKKFSFTELLVENEFTKCFQFRQFRPTSKKQYLNIKQSNGKKIVIELSDALTEQLEKQHHNDLREFINNFSDELRTWRGEKIHILKKREEFLDAFHKTLFWGIINIFKTELIKNIYFIPITITEQKKGKNVVGMLALNAMQAIKPNVIENIVLPIAKSVLSPLHVQEYEFLWEKASRRSASSAIMSRNMSHHIGSHVIPRTTLDVLKKRLVELFFNERSPDTLKEWHMLYEMTRDLKDPLDDYIRRKAEFIAEATTEPLLSTRSAQFFQEIVFPFIRNTALMDTLAANEGFGYSSFDSSSIVIRCFKKEEGKACNEFIPRFQHPVYGNEVKIGSGTLPCIPYAGRSANDRGTALVSFIEEEEQDVRVALPGPVGEMAFYGILENIIRNAAKHSGVQKDRDNTKTLEIHIVICDPTEESGHYTVEIYENLTRPNQEFDWKQDGQNKTGTLKEMLQHYIKASIIDDQGKLREKAWGIAEMAISASLLKGCLDLKSTSLQVETCPPVQKFFTTAMGASEFLIYTIRMMKARTALLIGFNGFQNRKEMERNGFSFVKKPDEFLEAKGSAEKAPTSFQFAVILADALQKEGEDQYLLDKIRHRLPFRIIIAGTNDTYERFSKYPCDALTCESPPMDDGADTLSKWLWKTWLRRWKIENETNDPCCHGIDLYLGQESDVEPTRSWIHKANKFNKECDKTHRPYGMRIWGKESSSDVKRFTDWERPPLNHRLVLDRHGLFAQHSNESLRLRDKGCYVVIDKSNADFDAVFNPSFSDPFVLPYELLEAGLLRILVIDERIAQKAMDSLGGTEGIREGVAFTLLGRDDFSPTLWHLAARANVFVATHLDILGASTNKGDVPLELELAKNEYGKRSNAFLKKTINKRRSSAYISCPSLKLTVDITKAKDDINIAIERVGPDFSDSKLSYPITDMDAVIIHQGILDNIKQQGKCEKKFLGRLQKKIPWLIIESGRGIPPEVRESRYKFLPFSIVERAFHGERVAKLGFTRALMELTRSR